MREVSIQIGQRQCQNIRRRHGPTIAQGLAKVDQRIADNGGGTVSYTHLAA